MSSSLLPENIGPTTTSIQPMLPLTMSTVFDPSGLAAVTACAARFGRARAASGACFCCRRRIRFVRGNAQGFDFQAFVHVEALFAVQAFHEVSRGFADRAGDAAGVDFYGAALRAILTVFVSQRDIVGVQVDLPYGRDLRMNR